MCRIQRPEVRLASGREGGGGNNCCLNGEHSSTTHKKKNSETWWSTCPNYPSGEKAVSSDRRHIHVLLCFWRDWLKDDPRGATKAWHIFSLKRKQIRSVQWLRPHSAPFAWLTGQNTEEKKNVEEDFPGGPVVKTPSSHCRGHEFQPWSGKSHTPRGTAKKEKAK